MCAVRCGGRAHPPLTADANSASEPSNTRWTAIVCVPTADFVCEIKGEYQVEKAKWVIH